MRFAVATAGESEDEVETTTVPPTDEAWWPRSETSAKIVAPVRCGVAEISNVGASGWTVVKVRVAETPTLPASFTARTRT